MERMTEGPVMLMLLKAGFEPERAMTICNRIAGIIGDYGITSKAVAEEFAAESKRILESA